MNQVLGVCGLPAGFRHFTAHSLLARILNLMNRSIFLIFHFFGQRQTADTVSIDTGARLCHNQKPVNPNYTAQIQSVPRSKHTPSLFENTVG
jgi:hypothetical protein